MNEYPFVTAHKQIPQEARVDDAIKQKGIGMREMVISVMVVLDWLVK